MPACTASSRGCCRSQGRQAAGRVRHQCLPAAVPGLSTMKLVTACWAQDTGNFVQYTDVHAGRCKEEERFIISGGRRQSGNIPQGSSAAAGLHAGPAEGGLLAWSV